MRSASERRRRPVSHTSRNRDHRDQRGLHHPSDFHAIAIQIPHAHLIPPFLHLSRLFPCRKSDLARGMGTWRQRTKGLRSSYSLPPHRKLQVGLPTSASKRRPC